MLGANCGRKLWAQTASVGVECLRTAHAKKADSAFVALPLAEHELGEHLDIIGEPKVLRQLWDDRMQFCRPVPPAAVLLLFVPLRLPSGPGGSLDVDLEPLELSDGLPQRLHHRLLPTDSVRAALQLGNLPDLLRQPADRLVEVHTEADRRPKHSGRHNAQPIRGFPIAGHVQPHWHDWRPELPSEFELCPPGTQSEDTSLYKTTRVVC